MEQQLEQHSVTTDRIAITEQYMQEYGNHIKMFIFQYVKNASAADDLTQDTFTKFYEKLHTYKGKSTLSTWLFQIAKNCARDYLRSWHHCKVEPQDMSTHDIRGMQTTEQQVITNEEGQQLLTAIEQLPTKQSEVIHLYYYAGLTTNEIAAVLSVNENTVETRLRDAKKKLRKLLGDE